MEDEVIGAACVERRDRVVKGAAGFFVGLDNIAIRSPGSGASDKVISDICYDYRDEGCHSLFGSG